MEALATAWLTTVEAVCVLTKKQQRKIKVNLKPLIYKFLGKVMFESISSFQLSGLVLAKFRYIPV